MTYDSYNLMKTDKLVLYVWEYVLLFLDDNMDEESDKFSNT